MNTFKKMFAVAGLTVLGMTVSSASAAILGPELVTNGTFETDLSGWSIWHGTIAQDLDTNGGSTYSMLVTNTGSGNADGEAYQFVPMESGKKYQVSFDEKNAGTSLYFSMGAANGDAGAFGQNGYSNANWANVSFEITVPGTTTTSVQLNMFPYTSGEAILLDNVSIKEVLVPEPASVMLIGMSALGLCIRRRRRSR